MRAAEACLAFVYVSSCLSRSSSTQFRQIRVSSKKRFSIGVTEVKQLTHEFRGGQQQPDLKHGVENELATNDTKHSISATGCESSVNQVNLSREEVLPSVSTEKRAKNGKLSNFKERTPPAILLLLGVYLLLRYTGENGLISLILAMQAFMYSEASSVLDDFEKKNGNYVVEDYAKSFSWQKWWWFTTALAFASGKNVVTKFTSIGHAQINFISFAMSAIGLVWVVVQSASISTVHQKVEDVLRSYLGKVVTCHFSLLFLVGQSSFWIRTAQEYGLVWVLYPAFLVIVNDTMAYIFGVLLGKHKIIPRLSPKKTVEGFVGAALSTIAIAAPLLKRMLGSDDVTHYVRHALTLALYVSLVSPFGGFFASAVKRAHGAKDFGALIPGHGGVVDRFDCQVVTAPFVYFYLKSFLDQKS